MVWPVQCVPVRGRDSLVPVHPDRGSVFGPAGFTPANVSFGIPWLACCCLPLEDCGCVVRSGLGPLITSASQSLSAWWNNLGLVSTVPTEDLGSYYFVYDTPRFIPSFTKCPSSFQAYNGMLRPSLLFSLSFCHALWIIITVIKVSRPLRGHHFSAGRSGNYRSC